MNEPNGHNPDRVGEARLELEHALERLERAFAAHAARAPAAAAGDTGADTGADAEALKDENAHLRAANENAAGRLDAAIGRLEKLLAE